MSTRQWRSQTHHAARIEWLELRQLLSLTTPSLDAIMAEPTIKILRHAVDVSPDSLPGGFQVNQIRKAYGLDQIFFNGGIVGDGTGQTIAIVDAYDNPNIASDLHVFDQAAGLSDPVLVKVNQTGGTSYPPGDVGWSEEIALDVQWAHVFAPGAKILLVEATNNSLSNLFTAVDYASAYPGVVAVSMSFGTNEFSGETSNDFHFTTSGVTYVSSTGDNGQPGGYPAYSPNVVAVGGTSLTTDGAGNYVSETGWSGSGGGVSTRENQPSYQNGVVTAKSSTKRTIPDVALDADPNTGVAIYDSYSSGWFIIGGTSLSSPLFAALTAVADQGRTVFGLSSLSGRTQTLPSLYSQPSTNYHDITSGNNSNLSTSNPNYHFYDAAAGYDLVTGRGTPKANLVVAGLAGSYFSGKVFQDANSNGVLDGGETGMAGVTVFDDVNNDGILGSEPSVVTDANGNYSLTLAAATHHIREVVPSGNSQTSPAGGAYNVTTTVGQQITGDNFGNLSSSVVVSFSSASQNVGEAAGTFTITAQLSAASGSNVSIPFTVTGTASGSGVDYTMTTTSPLVITAGNTSGSITGTIVDDSTYDPGETIIVTMGTPTGATLGSPSAHTITIVDNDSPISLGGAAAGQDVNDNQTIAAFSSFTVTDTSNPSASLTVQVSLDDSAKGVFTPASLTASGFTLQSPGVYQFVGNAAASQTAIRALVYDPTDNRVSVGSTETTTFTVTATDGSNPSASNNGTTVVSHSVNELPVVDLNGGAGGTGYSNTYTMGGTAASVGDASNLTVSDSDNTTLASASVSINSPDAGDQLAANTGGTSITASYSSGILSLTGSDTLAHYQQVLRSVTYSHAPAYPPVASRTISVIVNDGLNNSATATSSMTVQFVLGDTNGDGNVDLTDYNNVGNHYGETGNPVIGDTNGDGVVDLADYNNVQNHFGEQAAVQTATSGDPPPAAPAAMPSAVAATSSPATATAPAGEILFVAASVSMSGPPASADAGGAALASAAAVSPNQSSGAGGTSTAATLRSAASVSDGASLCLSIPSNSSGENAGLHVAFAGLSHSNARLDAFVVHDASNRTAQLHLSKAPRAPSEFIRSTKQGEAAKPVFAKWEIASESACVDEDLLALLTVR